jgi:hypothetical protein
MPSVRSGGAEDAFKLEAGDHVGQVGIMIGFVAARIKSLKAGRKDDRADSQGYFFFLVLKVNGISRAELFAGAAFAFQKIDAVLLVDDIFEGYCLLISNIDGFPLAKVLVVFVVYFLGAFFETGAAGDAFLQVYKTGVFQDLDFEIPFFTLDRADLREGQKLNVQMPADLDQSWREDSHRAVIGGKCLVQFGHDPAD